MMRQYSKQFLRLRMRTQCCFLKSTQSPSCQSEERDVGGTSSYLSLKIQLVYKLFLLDRCCAVMPSQEMRSHFLCKLSQWPGEYSILYYISSPTILILHWQMWRKTKWGQCTIVLINILVWNILKVLENNMLTLKVTNF